LLRLQWFLRGGLTRVTNAVLPGGERRCGPARRRRVPAHGAEQQAGNASVEAAMHDTRRRSKRGGVRSAAPFEARRRSKRGGAHRVESDTDSELHL